MEMIGKIRREATKHTRILSYATGSVFVIMWTLLRFFNHRSIFDLVSQQVIVHQWLHGTMTSAHMGITAYIPKMLLLYMPLDLLPGSPRLKLILMTLAVNLITFILLGLVLEKILAEYKILPTKFFYGVLAWLGAIAGSVFWIEFTNSRNIEVVGGLFLLYLGLRFLRKPVWQRGVGIAAFSGLLFFADSLQLYMTALPLVGYVWILTARKAYRRQVALQLTAALGVGLILSKGLFLLSQHLLLLSFTAPNKARLAQISPSWLVHSSKGLVKSFIILFEGAGDAGRLREFGNLVMSVFILSVGVWAILKQRIRGRLPLLIGSILVIDAMVYVMSGQALQADTSRYLIMTAPAVVLAAALIPSRWVERSSVTVGLSIVMLGNFLLLGGSLIHHWDTSFPEDAHLASVDRYRQEHSNTILYASTDTAIPVQYMYRLSAEQILPLGCLNGSLVKTHFSMEGAFASVIRHPEAKAAVVFDEQTITNTPNLCDSTSVIAQLGQPESTTTTDDGSLVLMYSQGDMRLLK